MQGILETCDALDSRQFILAVKKLADSLSYGTDKSPFRGSGIEFIQSRPYLPGDSVRAIDWRVTARTGRMFVKEHEAPKRLPVYLLLDTSASMMVGTHRKTKYATALHVAGGLAFACLERISPVGVVGLGSRDFRIEPSLSKDRILQWLHKLQRFRYDEATIIGKRIGELSPSLTSRAVVILLSDLHDADSMPALKLMAQKHDCIVLQFHDPAEHGLRGGGFLRAREAETGKPIVTRGRTAWLDLDNAAEELKRSNIDHLRIDIDKPFVPKLRQFCKSRDLFGRGAR